MRFSGAIMRYARRANRFSGFPPLPRTWLLLETAEAVPSA